MHERVCRRVMFRNLIKKEGRVKYYLEISVMVHRPFNVRTEQVIALPEALVTGTVQNISRQRRKSVIR
jgi:hypothetical protein